MLTNGPVILESQSGSLSAIRHGTRRIGSGSVFGWALRDPVDDEEAGEDLFGGG
jgi:hypothetical protein